MITAASFFSLVLVFWSLFPSSPSRLIAQANELDITILSSPVSHRAAVLSCLLALSVRQWALEGEVLNTDDPLYRMKGLWIKNLDYADPVHSVVTAMPVSEEAEEDETVGVPSESPESLISGDCWEVVFLNLDISSLLNCSEVCHSFYQIINQQPFIDRWLQENHITGVPPSVWRQRFLYLHGIETIRDHLSTLTGRTIQASDENLPQQLLSAYSSSNNFQRAIAQLLFSLPVTISSDASVSFEQVLLASSISTGALRGLVFGCNHPWLLSHYVPGSPLSQVNIGSLVEQPIKARQGLSLRPSHLLLLHREQQYFALMTASLHRCPGFMSSHEGYEVFL